jgi:hypothetical protein
LWHCRSLANSFVPPRLSAIYFLGLTHSVNKREKRELSARSLAESSQLFGQSLRDCDLALSHCLCVKSAVIRRSSKSISLHVSLNISPRRIPVSRAQMIIGLMCARGPEHSAISLNSSSLVNMRYRGFSSPGLMSDFPISKGFFNIHALDKATLKTRRIKDSSRLTVAIERWRLWGSPLLSVPRVFLPTITGAFSLTVL